VYVNTLEHAKLLHRPCL